MHFNKLGSSDNNMNLPLASSSTLHSFALLPSSAPTSSSASLAATTTKTKTATIHGLNLGLWWLLFVCVILMAQQQPCECRYLPTRSHGDDLDKLRELMLQILESSSEDAGVAQQQQRPPNEPNGNALTAAAAAAAAQRANWLNKLGGNMDSMDVPRKFNVPRNMYDTGRYY